MKKELYAKGFDNADLSATDYISIYPGRKIAGVIIDVADAPVDVKLTDEMGKTDTYTLDAGYHPISCTKIWKVGTTVTSLKVWY